MTKPMGPIPAGFAADADGMLMIGGRRADALVAEAGDTPLFVYDLALVDAKIARFRAAFPSTHLHYAIKANSYAPLLEHVQKHVDGLDIASGGELGFARDIGAHENRLAALAVDFGGDGGAFLFTAAGDDDAVIFLCEGERGGAADAGRATGDECNFGREVGFHTS